MTIKIELLIIIILLYNYSYKYQTPLSQCSEVNSPRYSIICPEMLVRLLDFIKYAGNRMFHNVVLLNVSLVLR